MADHKLNTNKPVGEALGQVIGLDTADNDNAKAILDQIKSILSQVLVTVVYNCDDVACVSKAVTGSGESSTLKNLPSSAEKRQEISAPTDDLTLRIGDRVVGTLSETDNEQNAAMFLKLLNLDDSTEGSCSKVDADNAIVGANRKASLKLYFNASADGKLGGVLKAGSAEIKVTIDIGYQVKLVRYKFLPKQKCKPPKCKPEKGEFVALLNCTADVEVASKVDIDLGFVKLSSVSAKLDARGSAQFEGDIVATQDYDCAAP